MPSFPASIAAAVAVAWAAAASGARGEAGADEIVVVVNPANPVQRLDAAQLDSIFRSGQRSWADGSTVVAFNHPPDSSLRVVFDRIVLGMQPDQVSRFWIDQRIRADQRPPRQINDPVLALRVTARLPGAICYLPAALADSTVRIVARVRDGSVRSP